MTSKPVTYEELFEKFKGTKLYKCKPADQQNELDTSTSERLNETMRSNWEEIRYESISDLIPYFPYLVSIAACDNADSNNSMVVLSSKSFVDIEEEDILSIYLKNLIKIHNRCKRKKIDFKVDEAVREVCWNNWNKKAITELAERVKLYGKKASINGMHLDMHERYRKELVDEMLKYGLNPSEYGYERFEKGNITDENY